jgi:hypothetical protein
MSDTQQFSFTLEQQEDFAFLIRFDQNIPPLLADEPQPLGKGAGPNPSRHLDRVLAQFEDFCVVTQSVRSGFPVSVTVRDGDGKVLKPV